MTRKKCAFLTMADPGDSPTDYVVSFAAMADLGWDVDTLAWRDVKVDWNTYDAVYICTPWDYPQHKDEFVQLLQNIEDSSAVLVNPLSLVHWTLAKTYLRDLEQRGTEIVPSIWFERFDAAQIPGWFDALGSDKVVIKPEVGANAQDTHVLHNPIAAETVSRLLETFRERAFLVQPFIENILLDGEYSLFYFSGAYSHAIRKIPRAGDFRVQEEYGGEIQSVQACEQLLAAGQHVMSFVDPQPVYARVDFVRGDNDKFLLMELELIEPSLYLSSDAAAASRFATAIDRYVLEVQV